MSRLGAALAAVLVAAALAGAQSTPRLGLGLTGNAGLDGNFKTIDQGVCRVADGCGSGGAFVNVRDPQFGVTGLDVADDTTGVKLALDSQPNRRAWYVFPKGTYKITSPLVWSQVNPTPAGGIGGGAIIQGAGPDNTVIDFQGAGFAFVLNDLRGDPAGNVAHVTIRDLTIKASAPSLGGVLVTDPAVDIIVDNVRFFGHTAATAIISRGQTSCACHSSYERLFVRNWLHGIWLSGFSNANEVTQIESLTIPATAYEYSALGASSLCASAGVPFPCCSDGPANAGHPPAGTCSGGPVCWASGQPYACCTGAGTGDGTGKCASDTQGGQDNNMFRLEASGGVGLGWNFANQADRNSCVKCVTDGATASATIGSAQTFVASVLNPDPTGSGVALSRMFGTAYSGNDSAVDFDQVPGAVSVTTNSAGASRGMRLRMNTSNPFYQFEAFGGTTGDHFQVTSATGATSAVELKAGSVVGLTVDGNGETTLTGIASDGTGKVACVKSDGTLGTCTTTVGAGGTCTCS